ncbi:MAG: rhodanese-like domain-containing protein [Bdellovibrionales bacterium]|nr:rhodanese-like domain-containing protein [Bdellovibrionales bacterium]
MKRLTLINAITLSFAINAYGATGADCSKDENYMDITKEELTTLVSEKKVVLLDANSEKSFKKNHIGDAVHFDKKRDIASQVPKGTAKDQLIVAYCGGKGCDAWKAAAQKACEEGFTNVKHFSAGISGWTSTKKNSL